MTNEGSGRQHYWDAARALLMLLGLPYHVAMLYHPGGWIVPVIHESAALGWVAAFIHLFRMPAFFVVAGYFAALLLERRNPAQWLRSRAIRLGVPLLVSLLTLVPLLNYLGELATYGPHVAMVEWTYQAASSGGYWVRHLWFLIVLLYLSAGAVALVGGLPRLATWRLPEATDSRWAGRLPALLLAVAIGVGFWEAVSIELFYKAGLNTNLVQQILRMDDLLSATPYFLLGAGLQRSPRLLAAFGRPSRAILLLGVAAIGFGLAFEERGWPPLGRFAGAIAAVFLTQMVISGARTWLDRPNRAIDRLVAGSFVIYLFHLPILIGLYGVGRLGALPPALGFPIILALTLALSWGAWLVVERSATLMTLFNGILPKRRNTPGGHPAYAS